MSDRQDEGLAGLLTTVDVCGSTNDEAKERARAGAPSGTAVAARRQTAGRGRRGHAWATGEGSLCLSVVLRPKVPPSFFVALPAVTMLGALSALREATGLGARLGIKWPNDLVANPDPDATGRWGTDGRKVAGLLVEAGHGDGGAFAVAGLGVNVRATATRAARDAAARGGAEVSPQALPPVSLEELLAGSGVTLPSLDDLTRLVHERVVLACGDWEARLHAVGAGQGPLACVLPDYRDCLPALGSQVTAIGPAGETIARGLFDDVDAWGRACVLRGDGSRVSLASEQASLRVLG